VRDVLCWHENQTLGFDRHWMEWFPKDVTANRLDEIPPNTGNSVSSPGIPEGNTTFDTWCLFLSEYNQYGQRIYYDIIPGTCWEVEVT
jgi:hypothetical protein